MRHSSIRYTLPLGVALAAAACRTPAAGTVKEADAPAAAPAIPDAPGAAPAEALPPIPDAPGGGQETAEAASTPGLELGETRFVDADGKDEDFWIGELVKASDQTVAGLKASTGSARRSAHSKAHGCVLGTFTPNPDRPADARVGVFAQDASHPVWIRFSNAQPRVQADTLPDGRGMAMKIVGVDGPKLLTGHEASNAVDFAFVSGPVFPVADVKEYLGLQQNAVRYLATHPRAGFLAAELAARVMKNPLLGTYWSMGAYKLGDRAVKFSTRPCAGPFSNLPLTLSPNFLREAMVRQLTTQGKEACFQFGVQFQKDPKAMPVENPSVEWRESPTLISRVERAITGNDPSSPFVPLATIKIPPQTFATAAQDSFCERLSYNPWRTLAAHRPLGNLMRARLKVYQASLRERMSENQTAVVSDDLTGTAADVGK